MLKVNKQLDINAFVDECFQFVVAHQKDGTNDQIPKGTMRYESRVSDLQELLKKTKQKVVQVNNLYFHIYCKLLIVFSLECINYSFH